MKRILLSSILVFTLIAVILALVTLIPKEKYTVPFEVDSVKTIDIYLFPRVLKTVEKSLLKESQSQAYWR